ARVGDGRAANDGCLDEDPVLAAADRAGARIDDAAAVSEIDAVEAAPRDGAGVRDRSRTGLVDVDPDRSATDRGRTLVDDGPALFDENPAAPTADLTAALVGDQATRLQIHTVLVRSRDE